MNGEDVRGNYKSWKSSNRNRQPEQVLAATILRMYVYISEVDFRSKARFLAKRNAAREIASNPFVRCLLTSHSLRN